MAYDLQEQLQDVKSPEHDAVLRFVKKKIEKSRSDMGAYYGRWDESDALFRGERIPDKEDRLNAVKGHPVKLIAPMVKAQVMTFVAFCVSNITQNDRFFQLEPTGVEDNPLAEPFELILERDVRRNMWSAFLVQFFLDIGLRSLGCAEVCYEEQTRKIRLPVTEVEETMGVKTTTTSTPWVDIPVFKGNRVHAVSPYRFFPDTTLPLTRYQEGEFCASEDFWSFSALQNATGLFNLDKIPKMTKDELATRKKKTRGEFGDFDVRENPLSGGQTDMDKDGYVKSGTVLVTKVVIDLTPKNVIVDGKEDGKTLGDEDWPVRYIVWYANDKTIIRFEEAYYLHGQFPYVCAQFLPDQHKTINEALADDCNPITQLITWLINAHVSQIKSSIRGKFLVDLAGVDRASLESDSPWVFLKKTASNTGIDRYVKQLQTADPSATFMNEVTGFSNLMEKFTSYSGQMQGEYSQGRRSATQDRVVAQGAAARPKTTLSTIWDTAFEPLAKQFISNNRQDMDAETFARIVGTSPTTKTNPVTQMPFTVDELFVLFKATPQDIAMSEDFFVFDATLPSEKAFLAQSLQEILVSMLQNPQVSMALGYGPTEFRSLFDDIYNLRGVTNARLPVPMQPQQQQAAAASIIPMPPAQPPVAPPSAVPNGQ